MGPNADPQQIRVRQLAALGIGVLVLVLLSLGVKGCLDSRKEQSLKDYNRDVSTLIQDADANADAFFETLASRASSSTDAQSQINQLRFSAQRLTKQAEDLSVPGEMRPAHRNLLLSLSLVQEAMGRVAEKIPKALATDPATAEPAVDGTAGEMQAFLTADVVYNRRTKTLVKQVLDEHEIGGQIIQSSSFLENLGWLAPPTVARRLNATAARGTGDGGSAAPAPGLHGHGLLSVGVGNLTLAGGANRIPASSNVTFNVKFANQGDNAESDVRVRVRITGAGTPTTVQKVVDQTTAKNEVTVAVPLGKTPPIDQAVQIIVEVLPVPGEKNTSNNAQTFSALFERS